MPCGLPRPWKEDVLIINRGTGFSAALSLVFLGAPLGGIHEPRRLGSIFGRRLRRSRPIGASRATGIQILGLVPSGTRFFAGAALVARATACAPASTLTAAAA